MKRPDPMKRGLVWCLHCGREQRVDVERCLELGWPECCGETMSLDSPEERKELQRNRDAMKALGSFGEQS